MSRVLIHDAAYGEWDSVIRVEQSGDDFAYDYTDLTGVVGAYHRYQARVPVVDNRATTRNVFEGNDNILLSRLYKLEIDIDLDTFAYFRNQIQKGHKYEEILFFEDMFRDEFIREVFDDEDEDVCCVCLVNYPDTVLDGGCEHRFCYPCVLGLMEKKMMNCPLCRAGFKNFIPHCFTDDERCGEDYFMVNHRRPRRG